MLWQYKDAMVECIDAEKGFDGLSDNSIDLIITDPPYAKEYFYLYELLGDHAPRVLRDGGSLITIAQTYCLPETCAVLGKNLKYRWLLYMNQFDGPHPRLSMGIEVMGKPMLWYVKRAFTPYRGMIRDGVKIEERSGQSKKRHKWEQSPDWCSYYIKMLTSEGDTVLDPFAGSFVSGEESVKMDRKYIGFDNDPECCEIGIERLRIVYELLQSKSCQSTYGEQTDSI